MSNSVGLSIKTSVGTARCTLSYSYSDCGLGEISYLSSDKYLNATQKEVFYKELLDYIKRGLFETVRPDGNKSYVYKAIITVSDRKRDSRYEGGVSIYDMMTRYAPALRKAGHVKFAASLVVLNPNSGNYIRQWSIACDGHKARYGGKGIY